MASSESEPDANSEILLPEVAYDPVQLNTNTVIIMIASIVSS